jgi:hypothetical protein
MEAVKTIQRNSLAYGVATGIMFILFFLIMSLIGLIQHFELSILNIVILFLMTNNALRRSLKHSDRRLTFLEIFGLCIQVSMIAFAILALFMFFYLYFWNPAFMEYMKTNAPMGSYLSPAGVVIFLLIQGIGAAIILSFGLEQYYKRKAAESRG